eukprot:gene15101-biopygen11370
MWAAVKKFHAEQSKGRKALEDEEARVRKEKPAKEEQQCWSAIVSGWKQRGKDDAARSKKTADDMSSLKAFI